MLLQATRLVRFIALDIPTDKMQLEFLCENIQHEDRIALLVFRLFCDFTINGGNEESVGKNGVHEHSQGVWQVFEGEYYRRVPLFFLSLVRSAETGNVF